LRHSFYSRHVLCLKFFKNSSYFKSLTALQLTWKLTYIRKVRIFHIHNSYQASHQNPAKIIINHTFLPRSPNFCVILLFFLVQ